jgi:MFS family permease
MISQAFAQFAYMGGFIISPLMLMQVFGYSVTATSFLTMLRPISFSLASPVGGAIAARIGERTMVILGMAGLVISMASFALGASLVSIPFIAGGLVIAGLAFGIFQPSASAIVGNSVDDQNFGIASSATSMTSSIGAVTGISVLTAFTADSSSPAVFFDGYAMGAAAAVVAFGAIWFTQGRGAAARARETLT